MMGFKLSLLLLAMCGAQVALLQNLDPIFPWQDIFLNSFEIPGGVWPVDINLGRIN